MSKWAIFSALGANLSGTAGHAVVEAGADGDQEVAVVHRVVGGGGTVHAQHAQGQRVGGVAGADAHQRGGDGDVEACGEARAGLQTHWR